MLKELINHVTMEIFSEPSQNILGTILDKSGFHWENKLKNAVLQKISVEIVSKNLQRQTSKALSQGFFLLREKKITP